MVVGFSSPSKSSKAQDGAPSRSRSSRRSHDSETVRERPAHLSVLKTTKMGKGGKGEKPLSAKKQALIGLVEKNGSATPAFKAVLGEIFRKYDKDKDGSLSSSELATFAEESGTGSSISQEERKQLGLFFEVDSSGNLTQKGFEQMYLMNTNHQPEDTWKDLEKLGYSKTLDLLDPEAAAEAAKAPPLTAEDIQKARAAELMAALSELKLQPESAAVNRRVGTAFETMGKKEAAQKNFDKADELERKANPPVDITESTVEEQD